ncbi:MAG: hypothetical protein H0W33_01140 [Gammaproteobacteria bacterium]|nr:hypothetical protein [Gammaproteobacteria bacterium]
MTGVYGLCRRCAAKSPVQHITGSALLPDTDCAAYAPRQSAASASVRDQSGYVPPVAERRGEQNEHEFRFHFDRHISAYLRA